MCRRMGPPTLLHFHFKFLRFWFLYHVQNTMHQVWALMLRFGLISKYVDLYHVQSTKTGRSEAFQITFFNLSETECPKCLSGFLKSAHYTKTQTHDHYSQPHRLCSAERSYLYRSVEIHNPVCQKNHRIQWRNYRHA